MRNFHEEIILVSMFVFKGFYKYWKNRKEEVYGQQEQTELKASYQQSLANKKERDHK